MNETSETPQGCQTCGATLPSEATAGLCPRCLMAGAMLPTQPDSNTGAILSPEALAPHFPQLEILECLGRGGMGVVYKARQKSLNRLVAIKILAPEREHDARFAERFAGEAEMLAQLNHTHIVTIHDFGETAGLFYLLMEFVDGVTLRDLLRDGKLDPEQALAIVPPICEALQYAHDKGIVHRDIKPENLLLDRDGRIKIADFGIAALVGAAGENIGTPPYMAPEQSGAQNGIDHRADIYALGVVLYEMLTGERPDSPLDLPSRKVRLDIRIDDIVLRALSQEPERRYQTAGDFRTVVETIAEPRTPASLVPDQVSDSSGAPPPRGKKRLILTLISVLLILPLLLVGLAIAWSNSMRPRVATPSDSSVIGRVAFNFEHPESLSGGFGVNLPVQERGDSGWFPKTYHTITLKGGTTLKVRARVSVTSPGHPEAFVSTSTNGINWETESTPIGPQRSKATLGFANGLQSTIKWQSQLNTTLSVRKEPPVGRFIDRWRNGAIALLALGVLAFISIIVARKRPGMFRRWWWVMPLMIPLGTCLGLLVATLNRSLQADEFVASTTIEVRPTESMDPSMPLDLFPEYFAPVERDATSPETLRAVSKRLDLASRWKLGESEVNPKLAGAVSAGIIRGTDLLSVRVRTTDAQDSSDVANAIAAILKEEYDSRLIIHQNATPPTIPAPLKPIGSTGPGIGTFLSPLMALTLMAFLHRRYPAPQRVVPKAPRPSDPNSRFHSRLSFGLFLAGTLGALLLMTLSPRHDLALIFGMGAVLTSLILGLMSWREPLSKFVVITIGGVFSGLVCLSLVVFSLRVAAENSAREEALKAAVEARRSMNLESLNRMLQPERQNPDQ